MGVPADDERSHFLFRLAVFRLAGFFLAFLLADFAGRFLVVFFLIVFFFVDFFFFAKIVTFGAGAIFFFPLERVT